MTRETFTESQLVLNPDPAYRDNFPDNIVTVIRERSAQRTPTKPVKCAKTNKRKGIFINFIN